MKTWPQNGNKPILCVRFFNQLLTPPNCINHWGTSLSCLSNLDVSSYNIVATSYMKLFMFSVIAIKQSLKYNSSLILATFWEINSHVWLVATMLESKQLQKDSTALEDIVSTLKCSAEI